MDEVSFPRSALGSPLAALSPALLGVVGYEYVPWWGNLLLALWISCLGANVGSFLNVVIFRLPEGLSVVHPGSRCPKCLQPIRWFDNIPILSWLLLRAKCRHCGLPISSRYPILEAVVAATFLVLAFVGPPTDGRNLPYTSIHGRGGLDLALWLTFAWHMLLLVTLLGAAMMRYDGHRPPFRLFVPALLVGLSGPWLWGLLPLLRSGWEWRWWPLHPVAFAPAGHWPDPSVGTLLPPAAGLWNSLCGLGAGVTLGAIAAWIGSPRRNRLLWSEVPAVALCGCVLGWQAVCLLANTAAGLDLATAIAARWSPWLRRVPWTLPLTAATTVFLIAWSWLVEHLTHLGVDAPITAFGIAAISVAVVSALAASVSIAKASLRPTPVGHPSSLIPPSAQVGAPSMSQPVEGHLEAILKSPSFQLAEEDTEFLKRPALRPVRLQLELLKPEMALAEHGVHSTIVAFGGTQIVERDEAQARLADARQMLASAPENPRARRAVARAERVLAKAAYYDAAREFSRLVSSACQVNGDCEFVIVTGGGPGIMEAANRGAYDAGAKSIGLNITLPQEQVPNPYITPELCFQFHYFALRKMHFLLRAKALVVFPGGFGTLDELFNALTLRQTNSMQPIPIILYGREYWRRAIDFQFLADEGVISDEHLDLIDYAETPEEAWSIILKFHAKSAKPPP